MSTKCDVKLKNKKKKTKNQKLVYYNCLRNSKMSMTHTFLFHQYLFNKNTKLNVEVYFPAGHQP